MADLSAEARSLVKDALRKQFFSQGAQAAPQVTGPAVSPLAQATAEPTPLQGLQNVQSQVQQGAAQRGAVIEGLKGINEKSIQKTGLAAQLQDLSPEAIRKGIEFGGEQEKRLRTVGLEKPFLEGLTPEGLELSGVTAGPEKFSASFKPSAERELEQEQARKLFEEDLKLGAGKRAATRSFSTISTSVKDFVDLLGDAFDEGGFGDIIKAGKVALSQKFLGGAVSKQFPATSAIPGKKVEIITKMMPLLTQQGDKPGSVRLVSTVFDRLADSFPGANKRGDLRGNDISLEESRRMLEESIKSMFRFSQAVLSLGITNESVANVPGKLVEGKSKGSLAPEKGSPLDEIGQLIENTSAQFFTEGSEEEERLKGFIDGLLSPLDERIAAQNQQTLTSEETQTQIDEIDRELAELGGV